MKLGGTDTSKLIYGILGFLAFSPLFITLYAMALSDINDCATYLRIELGCARSDFYFSTSFTYLLYSLPLSGSLLGLWLLLKNRPKKTPEA